MSAGSARVAALVGGLLVACGPDPWAELATDTGAPPTWAEVEPVLAEHCARCHTDGVRTDGGISVGERDGATSARVPIVCSSSGTDVIDAFAEHLQTGMGAEPCAGIPPLSMPPGAMTHLTLDEQLTLARWVAAGAPP